MTTFTDNKGVNTLDWAKQQAQETEKLLKTANNSAFLALLLIAGFTATLNGGVMAIMGAAMIAAAFVTHNSANKCNKEASMILSKTATIIERLHSLERNSAKVEYSLKHSVHELGDNILSYRTKLSKELKNPWAALFTKKETSAKLLNCIADIKKQTEALI